MKKKTHQILTHFGDANYQKYIFFGRMWCATWQWSDPPPPMYGSWYSPLHTGFQVLKFHKYNMDDYMAKKIGREAWDFCWELGQAKKLNWILNQVKQILLHEIIKIRL